MPVCPVRGQARGRRSHFVPWASIRATGGTGSSGASPEHMGVVAAFASAAGETLGSAVCPVPGRESQHHGGGHRSGEQDVLRILVERCRFVRRGFGYCCHCVPQDMCSTVFPARGFSPPPPRVALTSPVCPVRLGRWGLPPEGRGQGRGGHRARAHEGIEKTRLHAEFLRHLQRLRRGRQAEFCRCLRRFRRRVQT